LHQRSLSAQANFFSWSAVADRYVKALDLAGAAP